MNNAFDEILTQFAKRDTAGYIVWGQKLKAAHNEEVSNLHKEVVASNEFNDSLNKQLTELAADNTRLRAALKPVLEFSLQNLQSNPMQTIREAQRIHKEGEAE